MELLTNICIYAVCLAIFVAGWMLHSGENGYRRWFDLATSSGFVLVGFGFTLYPPLVFFGVLVIVVTNGAYTLTRWIMDYADHKLSKWEDYYHVHFK